jgi:membrane-bound lytic murein transglycosylase D
VVGRPDPIKRKPVPVKAETKTVPAAVATTKVTPPIEEPRLPAPTLVRNREVEAELAIYNRNGAKFISTSVEKLKVHYPVISEAFAKESIPKELMAVAIIESGVNPEARSISGAMGIWQFMKGTARLYGLTISWAKDDRKDPHLSSRAAAQHLRDLYFAYDDWYLALAAYNLGAAGVDRAIEQGKTRDFWELSRKGLIREQTKRYVPKFIAAAILMNEQLSNEYT